MKYLLTIPFVLLSIVSWSQSDTTTLQLKNEIQLLKQQQELNHKAYEDKLSNLERINGKLVGVVWAVLGVVGVIFGVLVTGNIINTNNINKKMFESTKTQLDQHVEIQLEEKFEKLVSTQLKEVEKELERLDIFAFALNDSDKSLDQAILVLDKYLSWLNKYPEEHSKKGRSLSGIVDIVIARLKKQDKVSTDNKTLLGRILDNLGNEYGLIKDQIKALLNEKNKK